MHASRRLGLLEEVCIHNYFVWHTPPVCMKTPPIVWHTLRLGGFKEEKRLNPILAPSLGDSVRSLGSARLELWFRLKFRLRARNSDFQAATLPESCRRGSAVQERGSGSVQRRGASQSVRETRDEFQSVPIHKTLQNNGFGAPVCCGISPKLLPALRGTHSHLSTPVLAHGQAAKGSWIHLLFGWCVGDRSLKHSRLPSAANRISPQFALEELLMDHSCLVDVSDIFFFSAWGRGRGSPGRQRKGGGGRFFIENPKKGGGVLLGKGGARVPGGCLQGIWGGGV